MPLTALLRASPVAPRRLGWLTWLSALLVAALFIGGKATERLVFGRRWHSFGRLDLAELAVLALAVGVCTWYVHHRMQQELDRLEAQRRRAEALAAENAAVVQAVGAVIREVAQPLSGALGYSELLALHADDLDRDARQEAQGLREGILRLAALLQRVRETVDHAPREGADPHLAQAVEESITPEALKT
jgi:signal transduction histidine kinase